MALEASWRLREWVSSLWLDGPQSQTLEQGLFLFCSYNSRHVNFLEFRIIDEIFAMETEDRSCLRVGTYNQGEVGPFVPNELAYKTYGPSPVGVPPRDHQPSIQRMSNADNQRVLGEICHMCRMRVMISTQQARFSITASRNKS